VHLVGFSIRIYHNARSPERQIHPLFTLMKLSLLLWAMKRRI